MKSYADHGQIFYAGCDFVREHVHPVLRPEHFVFTGSSVAVDRSLSCHRSILTYNNIRGSLVPVVALPLEEPAMILHDGVSACAIGMQAVVLLVVVVRAPSRNAHASANSTLNILRLPDPVPVHGPLRRVREPCKRLQLASA